MAIWQLSLIAIAVIGIGWLIVGVLRRPGIGRGADPEARGRLIEPGGDDVPARAEGLARPEDDDRSAARG
jgi:hypothetical protein